MPSSARDLYEVLGVGREATPDEIRRAYRKLAREHHPDVNGDAQAEERFKEIAGAYEILSDPQKRQQYDTFGQTGGPQGQGFADIQDIFDLFFGGGFGTGGRRGARSRSRRGEDLGVRVSLGFHDAMFGVRRELEVERLTTCPRCMGNGAEPGTAPIACRTCNGSGEQQTMRRSVFGTVMTSVPCGTCGGTGQEIPDPCESCRGQGRVRVKETVTVDIPAGVSDGMELRVSGNGHAGSNGGPAGDLYVGIVVEDAIAFDRRGQDLFTVLDITMTQAALGADIMIESMDGEERIRVEPGTDSGTVVRVKGKGVPNVSRRGRGDLFVTLHVVTPKSPSRDEKRLLEQLAELRHERRGRSDPARGELRRPEF